ncbi:phosphoglycerate kinase isoform B [Chlorella sorokiniana]|uniref:Phosphoglycerate kinase n=1 Tax=Chlorella sorokiniana TaxID=3076 RepID=A0A2P6TVQ0_CHLSO|nr:phosphoglycerate kinase isoform B [Chlorella sorokiniana]|eukprot:PRW58140.1 phosphoglycerate kinase isoform B [Chlorella sorokiniana]
MASAIAAQTAVVAQATQATRARGAQRVQACAGFKAAPLAQKKQSLKAAVAQRVAAPQGAGSRVVATMAKKSVGDLSKADLEGKVVFVRADLNVPLDGDLKITDDTRIRAAVPTLKYLTDNGAKVLLTSHLGRPKKGPEDKFRLNPVQPRLSELLGKAVKKVDDCIGDAVAKATAELKNGEVLLLENVRFYPEEEKNDAEFAKKLAANADIYVNDAFGTAHRAHASTEGVTKYLKPSVAGFLLQKELDYLDGAVSAPKRPFVAIVGGSKVSSKIGVIESLLEKCDKIILVSCDGQFLGAGKGCKSARGWGKSESLPEKCDKIILGGGMIFTFYKARGLNVGSSLVEEDKLALAKELEEKAKAKGVEFVLPTDVIVADKFAPDANTQTVEVTAIPDGWMGLDIGPKSIDLLKDTLKGAKTVIWNGPMGVFEFDAFSKGTFAIADELAGMQDCITIIGGGDSVAAVEKAGVAEKMSHISTGGGASLELLEGKVLPGVAALNEA